MPSVVFEFFKFVTCLKGKKKSFDLRFDRVILENNDLLSHGYGFNQGLFKRSKKFVSVLFSQGF